MSLVLDEIRQRVEGPGSVYVADRRLCLTKDGRVVEDTDPEAVILLVPKGGELAKAVAEKYKLVGDPVPAAEAAPGEPTRAELLARLEVAERERDEAREALAAATGEAAEATNADGSPATEATEKEAKPAANKGRKVATEDKTGDAPTQ